MDKLEIRQNYPATHDAIFADGVATERKRVAAHLKMGAQSGAAMYAIECIKSGVSFNDEDVQAEYMSCALSARDRADRQADSDLAGAMVANARSGAGASAGSPGAADDGEDSPLLVAAADIYCGKKKG